MAKKNLIAKYKEASPEERRKLAEKVGEEACNYEIKMRGCAQSVLAAIQQNLELGDTNVFKAASALAAGVAGNGEICGALLAGIMCIGVAYGRDNTEEFTRTSRTYQLARARGGILTDKFRKEFGSLRCNDILSKIVGRSFNMRDPEDYKLSGSIPEIHDKAANITCRKAAIMAIETILEPDPNVDSMMEVKK
jgi:C_GCAxxG_C_C family probable redox protein